MTLPEYEQMLFEKARRDPALLASVDGDLDRLRAEVKRRAAAGFSAVQQDGEKWNALLHAPNERTMKAILRGDTASPMLPVDLRTLPSAQWAEHEYGPLLLPPKALAALTDGRHADAEKLTAAHYALAGTGWLARWSVLTGSLHLERSEP